MSQGRHAGRDGRTGEGMPGDVREVPGADAGYDSGMVRPGLARRGSTQQQSHRHQRQGRFATWAALLLPGIVLLLVDGYDLGRVSLWRDEAYTLDAAHRSLPKVLAMLPTTDAVNNLYYVFMHVVIMLLGTSAVALRLPSLLAMAVAAVATAATGRRLALSSRLPAPTLVGLLAGLLFVAAPQVTRYAQEARAYGLVTMCATIATYLLLRAAADGRWRWWAGYGAVIALTGLLNALALLLVVPHAVTLLVARARQPRTQQRPAGSAPAEQPPDAAAPIRLGRWLAAVAAAVIVVSPVLALGFGQRKQVSWLVTPGPRAVNHLLIAFAGSKSLIALVAVVVLVAVLGCLAYRPRPLPLVDAATLALPWLVLPAAILLTVSQIRPVYDTRYVLYSTPALALLIATGLAWLTRLVASTQIGKAAGLLSWAPALVILAVFAGLVLAPQRSMRLPSARADNLRQVSAIVAANEHSGDAVLYLPVNKRGFSMGYPAPFRRLWDISLAKSPVAADNLLGTEVAVPVLRARAARVDRLWVVSGTSGLHMLVHPSGTEEHADVALLRSFHLIRRWRVAEAVLSLYARN